MTSFENILKRTRGMGLRPPATVEAIRAAEDALHVLLPEDYRAFFLVADGGEGPIGGESYLRLWPVRALP